MLTSDDDYLEGPSAESFSDDSGGNDDDSKENVFNNPSAQRTNKKSKTPVLDNFGRDLTLLAEEGKLDPVVGREKKLNEFHKSLADVRKTTLYL